MSEEQTVNIEEALARGHEGNNIRFRVVVWVVVVTILFAVAYHFGLWYFTEWLASRERVNEDRPQNAFMARPENKGIHVAPPPPIQQMVPVHRNSDKEDMKEMDDREGSGRNYAERKVKREEGIGLLNTYKRTADGKVRIPIERALDLVARDPSLIGGSAAGAGATTLPASVNRRSQTQPAATRPAGAGGDQ